MFHMPSHIDRYEIKSLIGAGGMGSLYLARDTNPNTSRLVAVKLLLANLDSGDLRERFAREARALAALNHPNIVDIYDSGEFQGAPFIVMEYVRGETIGEKIRRRAPLTLGQKLKLMVELCSGLEHAHEAGIIHRDIKPANLMVDQHGRLKILDFGIARVSESLTRAGVQVTQLNMRIGTPGYMSPEQIEGGEIDRRSDLFAVGTVCYELLSYREAFTGASTRQIENKVLEAHPEPLAAIIPDLDPEFEQIVTGALAKDPADRYQTAAELEAAFERLRWRLGPEPTPSPKPTPEPALLPSRKGRDSRADAAYLRSMALYAEGAHDAARRFAIEALAEDPEHEEARTFVERFGPKSWPPAPARTASPYTASGPTVLRTDSRPGGTMADAETVLSAQSHSSPAGSRGGPLPWWARHGKALQIAGIVFAAAALTGGAILLASWLWRSGPVLTVIRPDGGTLVARGIYCGTAGTDCSTQLAHGSVVELRAQPDEGFVFQGFSGDCAPNGWMKITDSASCGATFQRIAEPSVVPGMLLSIDAPRGGTIIGDGITCGSLGKECVTEHPQGKLVTLNAFPDADYTLRGFIGECSGTGQVLMDKERRCGAVFVANRIAGNVAAPRNTPPPAPTLPPARPPARGADAAPPTPDPLDRVPVTPGLTPPPGGGEAETPVRAPLPPARTPDAIAKDEIAQLLESYRRAYEARDWERLTGLHPAAPVKSLAYGLREYRSFDYSYTGPPEFIDLDPALGTATVKVGALLKPEKAKPQNMTNLFTLKRQRDTWTIVDLKYPK